MKILKNGILVDTWIGQCDSCSAVVECVKEELNRTINTSDDDSMYYRLCPFCRGINIAFHIINTEDAKDILNNLYK